jgi:hypothetical protein
MEKQIRIILESHTDQGGTGPATTIAGNHDELEKIFSDSKLQHLFPGGVKRLTIMRFWLNQDTSINGTWETSEFISDEVAAFIQAKFAEHQKALAAEEAKKLTRRNDAKDREAAENLFIEKWKARNAAVSALAQLSEKEKIPMLEAARDEAVDAFKAILPHITVVRNPGLTPEQKYTAYVALGIIKPEPEPEPETAMA